ncbi:MAG TPA: hypothetical protein VGM63_14360 [Mucilaginibacter sp.]|jgi:hypothetical protein
MSNLILTIMHGYDYPFVQPFLESLKTTGFNGDLVIFTSETVSKTTKRALVKNGAILIDYHSTYPFKPEYTEAFKNILPSASISNYRFVFYQQYLLANPGKYQNVMLTDIRDVIFQKDPFAGLSDKVINVFLEDPAQTFRNSELNYGWSSAANSKEVTDAILDEVVSCAGVTIGETSQVLQYLEYIKSKLEFRDELPWAFDQGAHNGFVHHLKPAGMRVFKNDDGFVATLGAYQPYELNSCGEIVNSKGKVYPVVHQYDRSGKLFTAVKLKYIGNRLVQKLKRAYFLLMP